MWNRLSPKKGWFAFFFVACVSPEKGLFAFFFVACVRQQLWTGRADQVYYEVREDVSFYHGLHQDTWFFSDIKETERPWVIFWGPQPFQTEVFLWPCSLINLLLKTSEGCIETNNIPSKIDRRPVVKKMELSEWFFARGEWGPGNCWPTRPSPSPSWWKWWWWLVLMMVAL